MVRNVRDTLSIDNRPTQITVAKVHQLILSETDNRADKEVVKEKEEQKDTKMKKAALHKKKEEAKHLLGEAFD